MGRLRVNQETIERLRFRACWVDAAVLLEEAAAQQAAAAVQRAAMLVERCMFTLDGWAEATAAVEHALSVSASEAQRPAALSEAGWLAYVQSTFHGEDRAHEAAHLLEQAAGAGSDPPTSAWIELRRGLVAEKLLDQPAEAEAHYTAAHTAAESVGDSLLLSYTCRHLGGLAYGTGDTDQAKRLFADSLELRHDCGFTVGVAPALHALAAVSPDPEAETLRSQADTLVRALGGVPAWLAS